MNTLEEAKELIRNNWEEGIECPCCHRFVKLYCYSFNSSMAKLLIFMYRENKGGNSEVHIENELLERGIKSVTVQSKLVHWKMLEPVPNTDPQKRMSGFYRITHCGINFVEGKTNVPRRIKYYNYKVYWKDDELISIRGALGKKFDYEELMA